MILPSNRVVIIGSGCFGISTAYHLLQRGYQDVTVLERGDRLPTQDAASSDLNKVVRTSYSDIFYAKLAQEAITLWKDEQEWGDSYNESGVLVLGSVSDEATYADQSYVNDVLIGARVKRLSGKEDIRTVFPPQVSVSSFDQTNGYYNRDGGWAHATQGLSMMISKVIAQKGKVLTGKNVSALVREDGKTKGVKCSDGSVFHAELVIIATGAWTASAFPELQLGEKCLATGQCIALLQLTEQESQIYKQCPVVVNFSTGFYIFPPNEQNLVKMAVHAAGYTHVPSAHGSISTPRTVSNAKDGLLIPKAALRELRSHLREVYPDLAEKPFVGTRMCWYTDSPDGDWIIGRYPTDPSLMLATAGSGHAYKFLPILGSLVADAIEDKLEPSITKKFALDRVPNSKVDQSRFGRRPEPLDLDQLCTPEDLQE